ncbi:hypothetical protein SUNI508_06647 [Seiridium unicorne]|uniref:Uncharacterized protein n=1 Tax=Seiridium unicorne TaxID=138068 RepID=A0ABR2V0L0_9PEZI
MREFTYHVGPFLDCYCDYFESFIKESDDLGALGHLTDTRGLTISLMEANSILGMSDAKSMLGGLLRKTQAYSLPTAYLKTEMAAILQRNSLFEVALSLLSEVRENKAQTTRCSLFYADVVLIITLLEMKDEDGAIRVGYELENSLYEPHTFSPMPPDRIDYDSDPRGDIDARRINLVIVPSKLEVALRNAGRQEEADKVQARLDGGVARDYGVEEISEDIQG